VQLRNIRPHSQYSPGDLVEVPDGAAYDDFCWESAPEQEAAIRGALADDGPHVPFPLEDPPAGPEPEPAAPAPGFPPAPKEM